MHKKRKQNRKFWNLFTVLVIASFLILFTLPINNPTGMVVEDSEQQSIASGFWDFIVDKIFESVDTVIFGVDHSDPDADSVIEEDVVQQEKQSISEQSDVSIFQQAEQEEKRIERLFQNMKLYSAGNIDFKNAESIFGICGDNTCNYGESYRSCSEDCKSNPPIKLFLEVLADGGEDFVTQKDQPTVFRGRGFSVDDDIIRYEWDFEGDGVFDYISDEPSVEYSYTKEGIYEAIFRVTNIYGYSHFDIVEVTVKSIGEIKGTEVTGRVTNQQPSSPNPDGQINYYAVLINGANEQRFWDDVIKIYPTLKDVYGFTDERIYLLNAHGTDPNGQNPKGMIDYEANEISLDLVFNELKTLIDEEDVLFVWINGHGLGYTGKDNTEHPAYYGYTSSVPEIDLGDEKDYLESDFKLRALFTGGIYRENHGMNIWKMKANYVPFLELSFFYRNKYLSHFENLNLEDGSTLSDEDVFIEKINDYLLGDINKDGYLDEASGEIYDFDEDGNPPYDPRTNTFDEDDWGLPDEVLNFDFVSTRTPKNSVIFDYGLDNKIDIDVKSKCSPNNLEECDIHSLDVDGTDLDNAGFFDGIDVNDDGDMADWVSIDELSVLNGYKLSDDKLKFYLSNLNFANLILFAEPCFSGGLIDDLSKKNTLIMTATVEEDVSWGNFFVDSFTTAIQEVEIADSNQDNKVSLVEAFNYASLNTYRKDNPQYDDDGDGIGHPAPIPNEDDGYLGENLFLKSYGINSPDFSVCIDTDYNQDASCILQDQGFCINKYKKGFAYTEDGFTRHEDRCYTQTIGGEEWSVLSEAFCRKSDWRAATTTIYCDRNSEICEDGACVPKPSEIIPPGDVNPNLPPGVPIGGPLAPGGPGGFAIWNWFTGLFSWGSEK